MKTSNGERSLKAYLSEQRDVIDAALERFLPDASTASRKLHEAMRHSIFSGGKRLRPVLALTTYELAGGEGGAVMAPACATELIHTYSLIHDDLPAMDDDDTRRGRPTCHRVFGEATAILAGDALLTLAFEIVAREVQLTPERRLSIVTELAAANGLAGMVGGQVADMEGEGTAATLETVEFIHLNKTALPLKAAVLVGALAAGAPSDHLLALGTFGEKMGLAFQIADDLLDVTGSEEEMGKAVGKDEGRGKLTYPAAAGVSGAAARAKELTEEALAALDVFGDEAWALREIAHFVVERRN